MFWHRNRVHGYHRRESLMNRLIRVTGVIFLMAAPGFAQSSTVIFDRSEFVTAAKINSADGYKFKVKGVGTIWLTGVKNKSGKKGTCLVHLPSIVAELKKKGKPKPEPQEVGLKFRNYGGSDFGCQGGGNDCVVKVELPKL